MSSYTNFISMQKTYAGAQYKAACCSHLNMNKYNVSLGDRRVCSVKG